MVRSSRPSPSSTTIVSRSAASATRSGGCPAGGPASASAARAASSRRHAVTHPPRPAPITRSAAGPRPRLRRRVAHGGDRLVEGLAEGGLGGVQRPPRGQVGRRAADAVVGHQEHHRPAPPHLADQVGHGVEGPVQLVGRLGHVTGQHDAPVGELGPAHLEGERDVGQLHLGVLAQVAGQVGAGRGQRVRAARGQHQQVRAARRLVGRPVPGRCLLEHGRRVGAAHAERVDQRPPRHRPRRPGHARGVHLERAGRGVQGRVGRGVVDLRRDHPVVQDQAGLDQPDHAGGAVHVPDVGLGRADRAGARRRVARQERRGHRGQLDRVAQGGAGAGACASIGSPSGVPVPCASSRWCRRSRRRWPGPRRSPRPGRAGPARRSRPAPARRCWWPCPGSPRRSGRRRAARPRCA